MNPTPLTSNGHRPAVLPEPRHDHGYGRPHAVLRLGMNMNHSGNVILVRQAQSLSVNAGQRIGDRRRQHAKQIGHGYQPPCLQSLSSGQPDEHADINAFSHQAYEHSGEASSRQDGTCIVAHRSARPMTATIRRSSSSGLSPVGGNAGQEEAGAAAAPAATITSMIIINTLRLELLLSTLSAA